MKRTYRAASPNQPFFTPGRRCSMSKVEMADVLTRAKAAIGNSPAEARRIIVEAGELDRKNKDYVAIQQIHARSFYKDEDLRAPQRFESALEILERHCSFSD